MRNDDERCGEDRPVVIFQNQVVTLKLPDFIRSFLHFLKGVTRGREINDSELRKTRLGMWSSERNQPKTKRHRAGVIDGRVHAKGLVRSIKNTTSLLWLGSLFSGFF